MEYLLGPVDQEIKQQDQQLTNTGVDGIPPCREHYWYSRFCSATPKLLVENLNTAAGHWAIIINNKQLKNRLIYVKQSSKSNYDYALIIIQVKEGLLIYAYL